MQRRRAADATRPLAHGMRAFLEAVRVAPPETLMSARFFQRAELLSACPVCESPEIAHAFLPDAARCDACGTYFRNPRPTGERIIRAYDSGGTYALWQSEEVIRGRVWQWRLELVLRHIASGRLLDVGTGDAHFLDVAQKHFRVTGTDLSAAAGEYARRRGHQVLVGPLEAQGLPEGSFDVVTLWHVLDHVPEPGKTLTLVRRLLTPRGVLVIAVGNGALPLMRHRLRSMVGVDTLWTPFDVLRVRPGIEIHLTHFVAETLERAIRRAGFIPVESGVDDVYVDRALLDVGELYLQTLLHRLSRRHFARAMYLICRRP